MSSQLVGDTEAAFYNVIAVSCQRGIKSQRTIHPRCKEVVYYSAKDNADEGDTPNKIAPDYV